MSKVCAFIPLRSGSERIKDKNIRIVGYYPLFYHIVNTCLSVNEIDRIVISTDSRHYKDLINTYFDDVDKVSVIIRPDLISKGDVKTEDAILHALDEDRELRSFEYMVLLQATTPLTEVNDVKKGIERIKEAGVKSVFSVSESKRFYLNDIEQIINRPMTQVKQPTMYEVGCFWVMDICSFKQEKNRVMKPFSTVTVSERSAIDIDDFDDLEVVDSILSKRIRVCERRYYKHRDYVKRDSSLYYKDGNIDPDGIKRNILHEENSRIEFARNEIDFINENLVDISCAGRPKLLSIGLGGGYAEKVIDSGYEKHGVEPDENASIIAGNNVDYIYNDTFENVYFEDSFFDVVFAHHVIEHVNDPVTFIKKVNNVLKNGGKLILGTPDFDCAAARRYGEKFRLLNDKTHVSLFSENGLRELLTDFGFTIDYVDHPYFDTKYFNKDNLLKILDNNIISPPFYGNIMTMYATRA